MCECSQPLQDVAYRLVPEFKILAEPINAGDKMVALGENQYCFVLHFIVLSYSQNGFSKDFLWYDSDPGGFLVALVIRRCVNATEATMKTACSVEEDGRDVSGCVGWKVEG